MLFKLYCQNSLSISVISVKWRTRSRKVISSVLSKRLTQSSLYQTGLTILELILLSRPSKCSRNPKRILKMWRLGTFLTWSIRLLYWLSGVLRWSRQTQLRISQVMQVLRWSWLSMSWRLKVSPRFLLILAPLTSTGNKQYNIYKFYY
mgnify:FL=1